MSKTAHEWALELAKMRDSAKRSSTETFGRSESLTANYIGLRGEIEFARLYQQQLNEADTPQGDGGIDFIIYINGHPVTIDIKTTPTPGNLLVKERDIGRCANILVLAHLDKDPGRLLLPDEEGDCVRMIGWETPRLIALSAPRVFHKNSNGMGIPTYFRPRKQLRPMWQFDYLMEDETDEQGNLLRPAPPSCGSL